MPPPYPPPPPLPPPPLPAWPPPDGPARNLGNPEPPRRRLEHPAREGTEGGEVPWGESGSAGEPEGRDRRAPGETWSQLSGRVRVELARPLRVESGHTSSPGVDPSRRQPDHRDLRQGGPRLPELDEEPAEGRGEPRTIERPRMRARLVDQGERARPPGEGRWHDPMPPPSPGESGAGSPELESTGSDGGGETAAGPRPKKARRGSRAPQSSRNHRKASRREDRGEAGAP